MVVGAGPVGGRQALHRVSVMVLRALPWVGLLNLWWVVPFAVSESSDARRERMQAPSFDQVAQAVLRIAQVDLDTSRPSDETALVTHPEA